MSPFATLRRIVVLFVCMLSVASAQNLTPLVPTESEVFEHPMFTDSGGTLYSHHLLVNFDGDALVPSSGATFAQSKNLKDLIRATRTDVLSSLESVGATYGSFSIEKVYPNDSYGPQTRAHLRTGASVTLKDVSQYTAIVFESPVPVGAATTFMASLSGISWADPPMMIELLTEPNDWAYNNPSTTTGFTQWDLHRVDAAGAWGFSQGSTTDPVRIGLSDFWSIPYSVYGEDAIHPDFRNDTLLGTPRLDNSAVGDKYGNHGINVAGFAGPITNNGQWSAAIGWDVKLKGETTGASGINSLACVTGGPSCDPVDVINMSWITSGSSCGLTYSSLENAVANALRLGIVMVGGAGNKTGPGALPAGGCVVYPAAYVFPTALNSDLTAQVIAASATDYDDDFAVAGDGNLWNSSPGTDPVGDPANAFIDFAAPGFGVFTLISGVENGSVVHNGVSGFGTSLSSPMIASLASLLLSVNPTLTPPQIYEALRESSEKVGQFAYTADSNGDQWNQYLGYGRINAYKAMKYVLETFGGTVGGSGKTVSLPDGLDIKASADVTIRPGTTVEVATAKNITVRGDFYANNVTFNSSTSGQYWHGMRFLTASTGTIQNSYLLNVSGGYASSGVAVHNASPTFSNVVLNIVDGGPGSYVYGIQTYGVGGSGPRIYGSTITSDSGPAVSISGGSAALHDSELIQSGGAAAIQVNSGRIDFWPPGNTPYVGYNDVRGGKLLSRNSGILNAGESAGLKSQNHFCDSAAGTLEVQNGGTIYARHNYWPTSSGPTSISGTGSIFYSNNLGASPCASNGTISLKSGSTGEGVAHAPERGSRQGLGDLDPRTSALLGARELRREGAYEEAGLALSTLALSGGDIGRTALAELAQTYAMNPLPSILTFVQELGQTEGETQGPALETEASIQAMNGRYDESVALYEQAASVYDDANAAFAARLAAANVLVSAKSYESASALIAALELSSEQDALDAHALAYLIEAYTGQQVARRSATGATRGESGAAKTGSSSSLLGDPYPNPTRDGVEMVLTAGGDARVSVSIFDALGRRVSTLAEDQVIDGRFILRADTSDLPAGVYIIRATAQSPSSSDAMTRTFTVVR